MPLLNYLNGYSKRPPSSLANQPPVGLTMRGPNGRTYTNIDPEDRKIKLRLGYEDVETPADAPK